MKPEASLILLHGFLGLPKDWNPVIRSSSCLQRARPCLLNLWEDLPLLQLSSMTQWLDAFVERYRRVAPFILCGYSLGARLAMSLASRYPNLIKALVLISGHPGLRSQGERDARLADDLHWGEVFLHRPWTEAIALWNARPVFGGHERHLDAEQFSAAKLAAALRLFSLAMQPDLRESLAAMVCPVLWVAGGNDPKFRQIAEEDWIKQSRIKTEIVPSCGHRVPFEKPRELAALLDSFLAPILFSEKVAT